MRKIKDYLSIFLRPFSGLLHLGEDKKKVVDDKLSLVANMHNKNVRRVNLVSLIIIILSMKDLLFSLSLEMVIHNLIVIFCLIITLYLQYLGKCKTAVSFFIIIINISTFHQGLRLYESNARYLLVLMTMVPRMFTSYEGNRSWNTSMSVLPIVLFFLIDFLHKTIPSISVDLASSFYHAVVVNLFVCSWLLAFFFDKMTNESMDKIMETLDEKMMIMKNVQQCIITVDHNHKIKNHSRYTNFFFNGIELDKINIIDLLLHNSNNISSDQVQQIGSCLRNILGENEITFFLNSHLLPHELEFKFENLEKDLEITWVPILMDEQVQQILITIKDVTEINKLKSDNVRRETDLAIIIEIVESGLNDFYENIAMLRNYLNEAIVVARRSSDGDIDDINHIFRCLHTIKGNSRSLNWKGIANISHDIEQYFDNIKKKKNNWRTQNALERLSFLEEKIYKYQFLFESRLKGKSNLSEKQSLDLIKKIRSIALENDIEENQKIKRIISAIDLEQFETLERILSPLSHGIEQDAVDLGKKVPIIDWGSERVLLPKNKKQLLRDIFTHIIRNSIDHGIEKSEVRLKNGKPNIGKISFKLEYNNQGILIRYSDDGRGLDLLSLSEKLRLSVPISDYAIAETIFNSGTSTAHSINKISGRGVGMDAVRTLVQNEGGCISIKFLQNRDISGFRSFEFVIFLPFEIPDYLKNNATY